MIDIGVYARAGLARPTRVAVLAPQRIPGIVCSASKRLGGVALVALLTALGLASPAAAVPKGIFGVFAGCPVSEPNVTLCVQGRASGGVAIGGTMFPIVNTITIQAGGINVVGPNPNLYDLVPPRGGSVLSRTEQRVPGGLTGLIRCGEIGSAAARMSCGSLVERGATGVTATIEVATSETNQVVMDFAAVAFEERSGITFPVRIHLNNPLLGGGCYIGSHTTPILLHLTDGATSPPSPGRPIRGTLGVISEEEEDLLTLTAVNGLVLLDNVFTVPVAEGCGGQFAPVIDPLLDARIGLPAKAGRSTAVLANNMKLALPEQILKSET